MRMTRMMNTNSSYMFIVLHVEISSPSSLSLAH